MSGQGSTREGRLGGGRQPELYLPRPFPRDGTLQKLPPEDTLTPGIISMLAVGLHSRLTHLHLTANPKTQGQEHFTHRLIPSCRPQTSAANTHPPQRSPTGFLGHTSHFMPHPEHTFKWTPVLCHINTQTFSISFVLQEIGTLRWDPSHLSGSATHSQIFKLHLADKTPYPNP